MREIVLAYSQTTNVISTLKKTGHLS